MKRFLILIPSLICCLLVSCRQEDIDASFILDNEVRMEAGGLEVFRFNPLTCQQSFNCDNRSFCVGTDTMSDFFAVKFNSLPVDVGQTVNGSLKWTTPSSISYKDDVALEVVKLEGDRVWLWSSASRIGLVLNYLYQ